MKIRPVGAELIHADGQTDGYDEANSRFSQFFESALISEPPRCHVMGLSWRAQVTAFSGVKSATSRYF